MPLGKSFSRAQAWAWVFPPVNRGDNGRQLIDNSWSLVLISGLMELMDINGGLMSLTDIKHLRACNTVDAEL